MMKKVYICAPLGGNVEENIEKAKEYAKYALMCGTAPVVPHFYALCLDDNNSEERIMGMEAGMSLLWFCDELWVFGEVISDGMKREIHFCNSLNIRVRYIKESQVKEKLIMWRRDAHEKKEIKKNLKCNGLCHDDINTQCFAGVCNR